MGFKAVGPASVAAVALGLAVYVVERSVLGATLVAIGVATIVFMMVAFPEVANRPIWGRPTTKEHRIRRGVLTVVGFGGVVLVAGLLLDSTVLLLLAVGYFGFWSVLVAVGRRR